MVAAPQGHSLAQRCLAFPIFEARRRQNGVRPDTEPIRRSESNCPTQLSPPSPDAVPHDLKIPSAAYPNAQTLRREDLMSKPH